MIRLPGAASVASIALLAGCGPGSAFDNSFRESYREQAVQGCLQSARTAPAMPGVDFQRICECAVDRHMAGKSATELMGEADDATQAGAQEATMQCVRELVPGAAAAMPADAPGPAGGPAGTGDKPAN